MSDNFLRAFINENTDPETWKFHNSQCFYTMLYLRTIASSPLKKLWFGFRKIQPTHRDIFIETTL